MGPELPMKTVAKELITGDIQFRGALSCFEPARSAIEAADYDPILLRYNPDDTYGDGANFEHVAKVLSAMLHDLGLPKHHPILRLKLKSPRCSVTMLPREKVRPQPMA